MGKLLLPLLLLMQLFAAKGVLIPFYHYPHHFDFSVEQLIDLKKKHPRVEFIVIINPDNGYVKKLESNFAEAIRQLSSNGLITIGYLHTSYGTRPLEESVKNVKRWAQYYKRFGISGIFVDEVNCTDGDYYKKLAEAIKEEFRLVVANPGVRCQEEPKWSDIVVVHENCCYPAVDNEGKENEAVLVYDSKKLELDTLSSYGYIYVTDHNGSNPWEKLSSHLPQILQSIELQFQKDLNKKRVKLQVQSHE